MIINPRISLVMRRDFDDKVETLAFFTSNVNHVPSLSIIRPPIKELSVPSRYMDGTNKSTVGSLNLRPRAQIKGLRA